MFARRSSPGVDQPIQRKSKSYVEGEVSAGRADWVDSENHWRGILCREMLFFGEKTLAPQAAECRSVDDSYMGLKFVPPPTWKNPTLPRVMALVAAHRNWDMTATA